MSIGREMEWEIFSNIVEKHIAEYTIPQYGDAPEDQVYKWEVSDIVTQLAKYTLRQDRGGGVRGKEEQCRDFLKIAHYACMAYMKLKKGGNSNV
jgi:hypothetical protein